MVLKKTIVKYFLSSTVSYYMLSLFGIFKQGGLLRGQNETAKKGTGKTHGGERTTVECTETVEGTKSKVTPYQHGKTF